VTKMAAEKSVPSRSGLQALEALNRVRNREVSACFIGRIRKWDIASVALNFRCGSQDKKKEMGLSDGWLPHWGGVGKEGTKAANSVELNSHVRDTGMKNKGP